jgi:hypothetical protein
MNWKMPTSRICFGIRPAVVVAFVHRSGGGKGYVQDRAHKAVHDITCGSWPRKRTALPSRYSTLWLGLQLGHSKGTFWHRGPLRFALVGQACLRECPPPCQRVRVRPTHAWFADAWYGMYLVPARAPRAQMTCTLRLDPPARLFFNAFSSSCLMPPPLPPCQPLLCWNVSLATMSYLTKDLESEKEGKNQ